MEAWNVVDIPTHPLTGSRWVEVVAEIRLNATGEVREYATHEILVDGETDPCTFIWEDGNFACDTNRALFFACAGREEAPADGSCQDSGKFSVRLRNKNSGRVYYNEIDETRPGAREDATISQLVDEICR